MRNFAAWFLTILLALLFLAAGAIKLVNSPGHGAGVRANRIRARASLSDRHSGSQRGSGAADSQSSFPGGLADCVHLFILHTAGTALLTVVLLVLALALAWLRRPARVSI
jgi:hypothetical protein